MKTLLNLFFSLCFLSPFTTIAQNQSVIVWEDTISVADGSVYGNTRPRITLNRQNEPVVVFGKNGTGAIHAAKFNGSDFDAPVQLSPPGFISYLANWTGPEIDGFGDTIMVVFKQDPLVEGHVYSVRSMDGGMSFSDTMRTDSHPAGVAWLPNIAFDSYGDPSVIYMAHDPTWGHPRYVVSHSEDGGQSFLPEQEVTLNITDEACDCCPAAYAIEDNTHALLYRNNEASIRDIHAVKSQDGGQTFPDFENIDQLFWSVSMCPSTGPDAFIDQGNLFAVTASRASGRYRCYVSKTDMVNTQSPAGGFMLPAPQSSVGNANFPRIHGNYDSLFVVWQASETSNYEVYCAFGTADDYSLFEQTKSQVNIQTNGTQSNPDIYYKDGYIHAVFQDGNTGNVLYRKGRLSAANLNELNPSELVVYPNPAKDIINITGLEQDTPFQIYALDGTEIGKGIVENDAPSISIEHLTSGAYILELSTKKIKFEKQ